MVSNLLVLPSGKMKVYEVDKHIVYYLLLKVT